MASASDDQTLILNAAKACYLRQGVAKTTAADIAAEAGISRATLYRRFPSHEEIFIRVLARDSLEMVKDSNVRLAPITKPSERIVEGMLFCLDEIPRRPLHAHLLQESSQWALTQVMPAETLHSMALGMLNDMLGPHNNSNSGKPLEDLAELVLRLLISYAMVPSHRARNRDEMRDFLHAMLDPTIKAVLGDSPVAAVEKTSGTPKKPGKKRGSKS